MDFLPNHIIRKPVVILVVVISHSNAIEHPLILTHAINKLQWNLSALKIEVFGFGYGYTVNNNEPKCVWIDKIHWSVQGNNNHRIFSFNKRVIEITDILLIKVNQMWTMCNGWAHNIYYSHDL